MSLAKLRTIGSAGCRPYRRHLCLLPDLRAIRIHPSSRCARHRRRTPEVRDGSNGHRRHSAQPARSARSDILPSPARRLQLAFGVAGIAAFLTARPSHRGLRHRGLPADRRWPRPSHRHPRHASAPMDRRSQRTLSKSVSAPALATFSATSRRSSRRRRRSSPPPPACSASSASSSRTSPSNPHQQLSQRSTCDRVHDSIRARRRLIRRPHLARFRSLLHHPEHHRAQSRHLARLRASLDQRRSSISAPHCSAHGCSAAADLPIVLAAAVGALAFACLLLLDPARAITASVFYPIGVSLYSVALVAYPSLLSPAATYARSAAARPDGSTPSPAGSALHSASAWARTSAMSRLRSSLSPPPSFLLPVLFRLFRDRPRELALTGLVLLIAFVVYRIQPSLPVAASPSAVERGRLVYISEGCIHCHSQYVRPNTADVLMWGPVEKPRRDSPATPAAHRQSPPGAGSVAGRRSPLRPLAQDAPLRSARSQRLVDHAVLCISFPGQRGNDLVAYLASLGAPAAEQHIVDEQQWHLSADAIASANPADGPQLYNRYCATCHNADGRTRLKWQSEFIESPAVLTARSALRVRSTAEGSAICRSIDHLAQIIKFGIPNSDMAGHEYLSDNDIASLSLWLAQNTAQPVSKTIAAFHFRRINNERPRPLCCHLSVFTLLFATSAFAQHQTFTVDPNASQVAWALGGNGHHVTGTFHVQSGTIDFDRTAHTISGSVVVAAGSGNSGEPSRDKKMNKDVLDVEHYSEITFAPQKFDGTIAPIRRLNHPGLRHLHAARHTARPHRSHADPHRQRSPHRENALHRALCEMGLERPKRLHPQSRQGSRHRPDAESEKSPRQASRRFVVSSRVALEEVEGAHECSLRGRRRFRFCRYELVC